MDVVLKDGKIDKIGKIKDKIAKGTVVDLKKSYVLPGLIDIHVHLREPGFEEKETIESGCAAAAVGGFTAVCSMPNTDPVTDNQETVRFIKEKAANQLVDVYPIGAVTKGSKGEELAEIGYMHGAGIVGISDDGIPILNSKIMRLSLEYCKKFGIPVISHAEEKELTATGCMNEGFQSTKLGLRGMPSVAEDIMVARDIMLAEFTGGKVHIAHVSTAASVELVRKAKAKGISVTAEAAPHHFTLTDKACETYDSYFKMNPPLRTKKDMSAIIKGLKDGTIDTIATDHAPHHTDVKEGEFDQAAFGVTGLETAIGVYFTELVDKHGFDDVKGLIDKFVVNPRKVINIDVPEIKEGMAAEISIIDPSQKWIVDKKEFCSRSENSCFLGKKLRGKPVGVVNKKRIWLNTY
ncbi:MAG: dihydroorotase [bacterium]|nr:dihydroorotase [bacterium]